LRWRPPPCRRLNRYPRSAAAVPTAIAMPMADAYGAVKTKTGACERRAIAPLTWAVESGAASGEVRGSHNHFKSRPASARGFSFRPGAQREPCPARLSASSLRRLISQSVTLRCERSEPSQVGYSRLAQFRSPISGKPEIGGRRPELGPAHPSRLALRASTSG